MNEVLTVKLNIILSEAILFMCHNHIYNNYIDSDLHFNSAEGVPNNVAVKVFKTTLNEFKNRSDYIKGDVRYFKDHFKKRNPRKILKIWALREDNNLRR